MNLDEAKAVIDSALSAKRTLVVVGECTVHYHGRAASKLASGDRIVLVKSDGSFLVHQNRGMAAINYQPPKGNRISTAFEGGALVLRAQRRSPKELLEAIFTKVAFAQSFEMKDDSSIRVFGTERNLSDLLMQDLDLIEPGLKPLKRESPLQKGMMDIFARDSRGRNVVVEIKRRTAGLDSVTQLHRYVEEVQHKLGGQPRGILCAPSITPNALKSLEKWGLEFFRLDYEVSNPSAKIKGLQPKQKVMREFL
jgi:RecB family endonuclease NucS